MDELFLSLKPAVDERLGRVSENSSNKILELESKLNVAAHTYLGQIKKSPSPKEKKYYVETSVSSST